MEQSSSRICRERKSSNLIRLFYENEIGEIFFDKENQLYLGVVKDHFYDNYTPFKYRLDDLLDILLPLINESRQTRFVKLYTIRYLTFHTTGDVHQQIPPIMFNCIFDHFENTIKNIYGCS